MRAEIIAIGDELITGQRLDTNSQWLAERLTEIGVEVAFHTTVGDNLADNMATFSTAFARADVVVATGGLGPTADDLTREALAQAVGVGLVRDEASLAHIRNLFASRGRRMPERNEVQADLPEGAIAVRNEHGTAPGVQMRIEREGNTPCWFFALPGVPAEMKPMWHESVAPAILAAQGAARVIRHRAIRCFGVGESQLEAMLPDLIRRGREPSVGITVSEATITLRITAGGVDDAACNAAMEPTLETIRHSLSTLVFGEGEEELEDIVARILFERGQTVAVAEWATGGLVSQWLARTPQAASILAGGVVLTSLPQLQYILGTLDIGLARAEDSRVATEAAEAVRQRCGADYGIGIAAFPADVDGKDAHVFISIASPERMRRLRFPSATHPAIRQSLTAKRALNALRLMLLGEEVHETS
ncbi:MAG TPA: CinA family nicotinamide mononucleotide deamidase-related protein [Lacipirellula sp.]